MPNNAVGGVAFVKVDGSLLELGGSFVVKVNDATRETKTGLSGVSGFVDTPSPPSIEAELNTVSATDIAALRKLVDGTVTAELINSWTYVLTPAWQVGELEINAADGTVSVKWEGKKMQSNGPAS